MKGLLKKAMGSVLFMIEELSTVLAEIEVIFNSRPLCPIDCPLQGLTPAHLLALTALPDTTSHHKALLSNTLPDTTSHHKALLSNTLPDITSHHKALLSNTLPDTTSHHKALLSNTLPDTTSHHKALLSNTRMP